MTATGAQRHSAPSCSDASSVVSLDSQDPRPEQHAGYPAPHGIGMDFVDAFSVNNRSALQLPHDPQASLGLDLLPSPAVSSQAHVGVYGNNAISSSIQRSGGSDDSPPGANGPFVTSLPAADLDYRPAPGSCTNQVTQSGTPPRDHMVPGIHVHGQHAEAAVATNSSEARIQSAATSDSPGDAVRPYCASRYEDDPPSAPGATDRVSQLKSRIRSLQRGHADDLLAPSEVQPVTESCRDGKASSVQSPVMHDSWQQSHYSAAPQNPPWPPSQRSSQPPEPQDKLSSILNFLDEVDESSRADMCSLLSSSARSSRAPVEAEVAGDIRVPNLAAARVPPLGLAGDAHSLQSRVALLEVEISDKKQIIGTLKHAVSGAKEKERLSIQEVVREWEEKMQKQKSHYEASLERQLQLVDRILNDKTELTKRCELFSEELKAVERKYQVKTEEMEEHNSKNLQRQKQNWMAAEKLRREAWEKEKTKEIKEITIKGLQPEVERILAERKQEKIKLEDRHKEMMDSQRRELMELGQKQLQEARDALVKDHEQRMDQERESHRQKIREEFEKFNAQLQDERSKCAADLLAERRKHEQRAKQEADTFESRLHDALTAERVKADAALEHVKGSASDLEQRHQREVLDMQERLRVEKEKWKQDFSEKMQLDYERREANLREELTKERDRQLEILVDRLGREHVEQQHVIKKDNAAAVDQVRAEAAEQARRLTEQLADAKAQVSALEQERALSQQSVATLENRVEAEGKRIADAESRVALLEADKAGLQSNAEKLEEGHRDELARLSDAKGRDIDALQQEKSQLSAQVLEERQRSEQIQKDAKDREEKLCGNLEARVKRTLQSKDETIGELRTRCAALDNKAREFEYLLARQREELLSGITKDILS